MSRTHKDNSGGNGLPRVTRTEVHEGPDGAHVRERSTVAPTGNEVYAEADPADTQELPLARAANRQPLTPPAAGDTAVHPAIDSGDTVAGEEVIIDPTAPGIRVEPTTSYVLREQNSNRAMNGGIKK